MFYHLWTAEHMNRIMEFQTAQLRGYLLWNLDGQADGAPVTQTKESIGKLNRFTMMWDVYYLLTGKEFKDFITYIELRVREDEDNCDVITSRS